MKNFRVFQVIIYLLLPFVLLAQTENWAYRYNGSFNDADNAISLVYGADGNIYAAGCTWHIGTRKDFTVISLTTAGDTNWVYWYTINNFNTFDMARCIVYGTDGNIYVAGTSTSEYGWENWNVSR